MCVSWWWRLVGWGWGRLATKTPTNSWQQGRRGSACHSYEGLWLLNQTVTRMCGAPSRPGQRTPFLFRHERVGGWAERGGFEIRTVTPGPSQSPMLQRLPLCSLDGPSGGGFLHGGSMQRGCTSACLELKTANRVGLCMLCLASIKRRGCRGSRQDCKLFRNWHIHPSGGRCHRPAGCLQVVLLGMDMRSQRSKDRIMPQARATGSRQPAEACSAPVAAWVARHGCSAPERHCLAAPVCVSRCAWGPPERCAKRAMDEQVRQRLVLCASRCEGTPARGLRVAQLHVVTAQPPRDRACLFMAELAGLPRRLPTSSSTARLGSCPQGRCTWWLSPACPSSSPRCGGCAYGWLGCQYRDCWQRSWGG